MAKKKGVRKFVQFGYPKCMSSKPFVKVFNRAEEAAWVAANKDAARLEGELTEIQRLQAENIELAANQKKTPGPKAKTDDNSE